MVEGLKWTSPEKKPQDGLLLECLIITGGITESAIQTCWQHLEEQLLTVLLLLLLLVVPGTQGWGFRSRLTGRQVVHETKPRNKEVN